MFRPENVGYFFHGKSYAIILTQKGLLGYTLGVFSQTHPVTLTGHYNLQTNVHYSVGAGSVPPTGKTTFGGTYFL
jgi:hypothetical protein